MIDDSLIREIAHDLPARVRPFGLDICSGVRSGGRLDEDKLRRYVLAARAADDLCG